MGCSAIAILAATESVKLAADTKMGKEEGHV